MTSGEATGSGAGGERVDAMNVGWLAAEGAGAFRGKGWKGKPKFEGHRELGRKKTEVQGGRRNGFEENPGSCEAD